METCEKMSVATHGKRWSSWRKFSCIPEVILGGNPREISGGTPGRTLGRTGSKTQARTVEKIPDGTVGGIPARISVETIARNH